MKSLSEIEIRLRREDEVVQKKERLIESVDCPVQ
jgi:hypothetical protein